jgi:transposase
MKPPDLPTIPEKDFETLPQWAKDYFVVLRATCEMWKAIALRQEAEILELKAEIKALKEENAKLRERVAQLEAQLRQNSNNSSKPPSSDPLHLAAKRLQDKIRSGKKPGGQPGHGKHEQKVIPTEDVRQVFPERCKDCHAPLSGNDPEPRLHQHIEIPKIQPDVTHFLLHQLTCSGCGAVTRGHVPAGNRSSFGPRLEALVSHLTGFYRFSKRKIVGLLDEVLGIPISLGMVCKLQARTTRALEAGMAEIDGRIMNSAESKNVDETGQRVCGKLQFAWVASSPSAVKIGIGPRSMDSFEKLVGQNQGVITSDRFPVYHHLEPERWQICWSHLTRDFQAAVEERNETSATANGLKQIAKRMFRSWNSVRDGTRSRMVFVQNSLGRIRSQFRKALEEGAQFGKRKLATLSRFLLSHWTSLWRYAHVEGVEPTNNEAERQLRELVIYRKISLCIQSAIGQRFVESIFSVIATCKLHKIRPLEYLGACIESFRLKLPAPVLIPG